MREETKDTLLQLCAMVGGSLFALAAIAVAITMVREPIVHAQTAYLPFTGPGPNPTWTCRVTAITAATECRAVAAAGTRNYVTDVTISNNVGTAQTVKLVTGTGSNCAGATADLTHAVQFGAAVGNWDHVYETALVPTVGHAICVTPSAATSVSATITGLVGP